MCTFTPTRIWPGQQALVEAIRADGGQAEALAFDVTDADASRATLEALIADAPIQVLVNNAGIHDDAVFPGMNAAQWHSVLDVSLNGFFNVTQPLTMAMIRSRWGRIIKITSIAGITGNRGQVNYSAAKGALHAATKSLSLELASRGVTVNAVAPGIIADRHDRRRIRQASHREHGADETRRAAGRSRERCQLSCLGAGKLPHWPDHLGQWRHDLSAPAQTLAVHQTEALLFFTLLQLTLIVLAGRIGGALAQRVGQSPAVGEIIVGILLGPSLFGLLAPDLFQYVFHSTPAAPMQMLSQIGLILLMFQIGLEFDFAHLTERNNRRAVTFIASASMIAPFALGFGFGWFTAPLLSPGVDQLASALFIATAFSITALPILGRIMMEFRITRLPIGVIAISAAAINDVVGWLLLALITALTLAEFSAAAFALKVALVGAFFLVWWFVVRPLMKRVIQLTQASPAPVGEKAGRGKLTHNLLGILLAGIFISAMTTYQLGIFAIFGGFMMGVILHDEHELIEAWKERLSHFVMVFFLPIFFTYTGLRTNVGGLDSLAAWGWCGLLIALATLGKFGASYLAARWAGMSHVEGKVIGIMMNTRALMELIVINVGFDLGVISQQVFTMLVLMAIFSTVITTPGLRRWLPKMGIDVARRH